MREEKIYYKVYDTELKDYVYRITQNSFINLEFNSIEEARSYDDGWLRDKTRYEVHKFTRIIASDCVNCDPATEEDVKRLDTEQMKKDDYNKRMKEYVNTFNPRNKMEEEQLELQFAQLEALKKFQNAIKKANENLYERLEKEFKEKLQKIIDKSR